MSLTGLPELKQALDRNSVLQSDGNTLATNQLFTTKELTGSVNMLGAKVEKLSAAMDEVVLLLKGLLGTDRPTESAEFVIGPTGTKPKE